MNRLPDRFSSILSLLHAAFGSRIDCENIAGDLTLWELQHGKTLARTTILLRGMDAIRRARSEGTRLVRSDYKRRSPEPRPPLTDEVMALMNEAGLSPTEKLLIYQRWWEGLQVTEIAAAQGRRRERVAEDFQVILNKLRSSGYDPRI